MADTTPLVVLGAGPGGHAAAFLAADLGMSVVLIDEEANPGGVCTYRGCIPSKALLHVAKLLEETKHASAWGIDFGAPSIDIDRLRSYKQGVVDRLTGGLGQLTRQRKITYIQGRASFVDAHTLKVALTAGGEQDVRFEKLIIATGSRPTTLPNLNLSPERLLDSTGALEMKQIPKRLLVIGGGYIGLELGTVYAALGTEVSVVEMLDRILPGADRDLVNVLAKRIRKVCKQVLTSTKVANIEEKADGVHVTFEGELAEKTQVFDQVLVSIGRRPNGHIPGIEATGVEVTARGFITVDPQRRTTVPHIYAIGDVAGDPMLAHKATYDAKIAVEHIAGHKVAFEPAAIPAVVFTDPELAWCG
uniref:dihydrolipoyl dehydrogenase family protein n=1 Tax=Luteitalea sp. TaxID=2004800 RepID=UPI0037C70838